METKKYNNQQNQLDKGVNFIKNGEIDYGLKILNDILKENKNNQQIKKIIKKTLIKNKVLTTKDYNIKLKELIKNKQYVLAKYLLKHIIKKTKATNKTYNLLSTVEIELGEIDSAINNLIISKKLNNRDLETIKNLGNLYLTIGNTDKAIEQFTYITKNDPLDGENHRLMSRSKKYKHTSDKHIIQMENIFNNENESSELKINICFSLGNIFELLHNKEKSFFYYNHGNNIQNKRLRFDLNKEQYIINKIQEVYTKSKINNLKKTGSKDPRPIFILGMPRSGTSLVEQILSSQSQVHGGGELPYIEEYLLQNRGAIGIRIPSILNQPTIESIDKFSNYYSKKLTYINSSADFITDKMPGNFKWIGMIKSAYPKSKIIHVKRNPMDTCFSIFKSYFANDTCEYSYNQINLAKFYNLYLDIMEHWNNVLPGEIYNCYYEELVNNKETEIKKLVDYCQLSWEKKILNFHENKRRVTTVSTVQIRKKIYTTSINAWENYKNELKPLSKILKKTLL